MAAAPQTNLITITINDIEISVPKGELIVESVKRLGLEIPIFCYHPRMKPVGMCRMCLVEVGFKQPDGSVRMMPKPQAGCTLPAGENMVVYTDSEAVHRDRKGVLEFLLINHPLDCPICDRGGECPLQNNTLAYGPSTTRFVELKRHLPKAYPLSHYVTLDLERCIQCGRCVRFTEEISGDSQLAFRFRGADMQPSTFQLTEFESRFSGNVIEICPVGALTSSKYRFRARPWDLETKPGLCTVTPDGTNVWFDHRVGRYVRINGRTNEAVNEEWTCDKTKFGHEFYNSPDRLKSVNMRSGDGFRLGSWAEAFREVLSAFEVGGDAVGCMVGPSLSNEDFYLLQKLFRQGFGSNSLDHRFGTTLLDRTSRPDVKLGRSLVQTTIAELEHKDAVLIFGTNLADTAPMSFLRVRKGWFQRGMKVVVAHHEASEAESFAHVVIRYKEGAAEAVAKALAGGAVGADFESATGVSSGKIDDARAALSGDQAFLTSSGLLNAKGGAAAVEALAGIGVPFSMLAAGPNEQGAMEMGVLPDMGPGGASLDKPGLNTRQMLEAARDGKLKALWLVNCDPLTDFGDRELALAALENVPFLVVQHWRETEACAYASVVLPMTLPAEQDGTYTNYERRVQLMRQIIAAPGEAKPSWRIFADVLLRVHAATPSFNTGEIMHEIGDEIEAWAAASYDRLGGEGIVLGAGTPALT
jgi:NADH-quinone oxidoreductase subunit G